MAKNSAQKTAAARAKKASQVSAVAPVVQAAVQAVIESVAEEPTSEYVVLCPISHHKTPYKRGEHVDLADDYAEPLLALKVIAPYVEAEEAK